MDSSPTIPYQAYRSKRHSRTVSNSQLEPAITPSPQSRRSSTHLSPRLGTSPPTKNGTPLVHNVFDDDDTETQLNVKSAEKPTSTANGAHPLPVIVPIPTSSPPPRIEDKVQPELKPAVTTPSVSSSSADTLNVPVSNAVRPKTVPTINVESGPSQKPEITQRRSSTFKHIPLRPPAAAGRTSSPLVPSTAHRRNLSSASGVTLSESQTRPNELQHRAPSSFSTRVIAPSPISRSSSLQAPPMAHSTSSTSTTSHKSSPLTSTVITPSTILTPEAVKPVPRTVSLGQSNTPSTPSTTSRGPPSYSNSRINSPSPSSSPAQRSLTATPDLRAASPAYRTTYRPGFQPKGVYRPVTDEFLEFRAKAREANRIEQTRLERRFEKLVNLHFLEDQAPAKEGDQQEKQIPQTLRRASSIFDLDLKDLRSKGAAELWRTVVDNRQSAAPVSKGSIRAAEQKITPWQSDSDVSACPHCSASFHPLSNRKHHCRLCGRIICSLPPKKPQRPVPCSLLFVVDQKTGRIEEVGEGVDYGVRQRKSSNSQGPDPSEAEKFLKGVRICKECKPVMLRQQYKQESRVKPPFARLYDALIALEGEIEEALPVFQELMLSLSNNPDDAPAKEATAARKRLLEAFAEYDALAKRIRKLSCPEGPGSSQDRVQAAILSRATMFLQRNMFPLQSLPKAKKKQSASCSDPTNSNNAPVIDPDSELALALQPLLEQEALLESFIEEAKSHRKFEDTKTLKNNLTEIRGEIERIVANAEGGGQFTYRARN